MLEFAGRVGFGMDIGNFLELQRAFQGHRELRATAEEQGVVLLGEQLETFSTVRFIASASPSRVGRRRSSSTSSASTPSARRFCTWPMPRVSSSRATNWVVKALVEATPISGPAWVSRVRSDSRTSELVATLQIATLERKPSSLALRRAARVSAVSPDWEMVTNRQSGCTATLR